MERSAKVMHLHILGIGGTFMAGLAALATESGFRVTGSDQTMYPPMSTQLAELGIALSGDYADLSPLKLEPDFFVVGNVMRRGMPIVEAMLDQQWPMLSGPECLARFILPHRPVWAVSGTHGKTTVSSMLAWMMESVGIAPGFLIGGIPRNFGISARLGSGQPFVVEADEYDSAFFDKRSKFVHYRPKVLVINNIEFDHADIFPDLAAIQQQFHHCVRTVPANGLIVHPAADETVLQVLAKGCWTPCTTFGSAEPPAQRPLHSADAPQWWALVADAQGSDFEIYQGAHCYGRVQWSLIGQHNVQNALAAMAAVSEIAHDHLPACVAALCSFAGVKRRLECIGHRSGVTVYEDFAHHPTAIKTTLEGLRAAIGKAVRLIAVLDIRSNTMRAGHHRDRLAEALAAADQVYYFYPQDGAWDLESYTQTGEKKSSYCVAQALIDALQVSIRPGDHVLFMSNGSFSGIPLKFFSLLL